MYYSNGLEKSDPSEILCRSPAFYRDPKQGQSTKCTILKPIHLKSKNKLTFLRHNFTFSHTYNIEEWESMKIEI